MKHGAAPQQRETFLPTNKQRISIVLSESEHRKLAELAARNNLSMAWIGHKAILDFLGQQHGKALQLPLTHSKRGGRSKEGPESGPR